MRVEKDQVLARLDDVTVKLQLALAESELSSARKSLTETEVRLAEAALSLKRAEDLAGQGVSSQAALDAARAERDSLQARLRVGGEQASVAARVVALRRQDLEDTIVRAPPARRSAMIPLPTTAARRSAVPTASAATRREREGRETIDMTRAPGSSRGAPRPDGAPHAWQNRRRGS